MKETLYNVIKTQPFSISVLLNRNTHLTTGLSQLFSHFFLGNISDVVLVKTIKLNKMLLWIIQKNVLFGGKYCKGIIMPGFLLTLPSGPGQSSSRNVRYFGTNSGKAAGIVWINLP